VYVVVCVAACCSVLQRVAVRCSVLQCVAVSVPLRPLIVRRDDVSYSYSRWSAKVMPMCVLQRVLQCVAVCCSVLQRVAVCCSVLQCVAMRVLLGLPLTMRPMCMLKVCCSVCSVLQHQTLAYSRWSAKLLPACVLQCML